VIIEPEQPVNSNYQKEELLKDLEHLKGFLNSINKKLDNKKFVENAKPEVIALERKKKEDAEEKIKVLEESLSSVK
jgi:valyl-tRNA synthetase